MKPGIMHRKDFVTEQTQTQNKRTRYQQGPEYTGIFLLANN